MYVYIYIYVIIYNINMAYSIWSIYIYIFCLVFMCIIIIIIIIITIIIITIIIIINQGSTGYCNSALLNSSGFPRGCHGTILRSAPGRGRSEPSLPMAPRGKALQSRVVNLIATMKSKSKEYKDQRFIWPTSTLKMSGESCLETSCDMIAFPKSNIN